MRFLLHGEFRDAVRKALEKHEHAAHTAADLPDGTMPATAEELFPLLEKQQWNLLTNDTAVIRDLYEKKIQFSGVIVQILDEIKLAKEQADAIERLFERYKRLTPRRLYTVTASRVKIRQLPGGHG